MDWNEQIAIEPASPVRAGGLRRGIATAFLAAGLLVVGGAAAVSAADPSASPSPNATTTPSTPGSGGTTTRPNHTSGDCPNMGTDGSGGQTPSATPNASSSDT
jgi:hypothetical protein